jgi:hypothetical protein
MRAHALNPILNVSDLAASIRWFESLGWEKAWDWGDRPASVRYGPGLVRSSCARTGRAGADTAAYQ